MVQSAAVVGDFDGATEGDFVGHLLGLKDGLADGLLVGPAPSPPVGLLLGDGVSSGPWTHVVAPEIVSVSQPLGHVLHSAIV